MEFQVFWMRFFSILGGPNLPKACFSLVKAWFSRNQRFRKSMVFIIIFGVQKSTPGSKMWSKDHAFSYVFSCFFIWKTSFFDGIRGIYWRSGFFVFFVFLCFFSVFVGWLFSTPFGGYLVDLVFLVALRIASDPSESSISWWVYWLSQKNTFFQEKTGFQKIHFVIKKNKHTK